MWDTVLQMWRFPAEPQVVFHVGSSSRKLPLVSRRSVSTRVSRLLITVWLLRDCLTTCTEVYTSAHIYSASRDSSHNSTLVSMLL